MDELLESVIKQCIAEKTPTCQCNLSKPCTRESRLSPSQIIDIQSSFPTDLCSKTIKLRVNEWLSSVGICWIEKFDIQLSHDKSLLDVKLTLESCINRNLKL